MQVVYTPAAAFHVWEKALVGCRAGQLMYTSFNASVWHHGMGGTVALHQIRRSRA